MFEICIKVYSFRIAPCPLGDTLNCLLLSILIRSVFYCLKMTIVFESFIDLGSPIQGQMIWNKKKQKVIVIIRVIKFQT